MNANILFEGYTPRPMHKADAAFRSKIITQGKAPWQYPTPPYKQHPASEACRDVDDVAIDIVHRFSRQVNDFSSCSGVAHLLVHAVPHLTFPPASSQ